MSAFQLSFCLGLALHKLFVLDFQFGQDMGFFICWHAAVPDMSRNHFRYIFVLGAERNGLA